MQKIGRVAEVFRYPVSSLGGERPGSIVVSASGVAGDRRFGLRDPLTGRQAAPEQEARWRPALLLRALDGGAGVPQIAFPDGRLVSLDAEDLAEHLETHFGFAAAIGVHEAFADEAPAHFARIAPRYEVAPLHLVTTASLSKLAGLGALADVDPRRFRPTVLIETQEGEDGFVENHWIGKAIRIGAHRISVTEATRRCGMTLIAQPGLAEDANVLRAIMRHNARHLGVYGRLAEETATAVTISVDDAVYAES
jgi:uncharacterized protein